MDDLEPILPIFVEVGHKLLTCLVDQSVILKNEAAI